MSGSTDVPTDRGPYRTGNERVNRTEINGDLVTIFDVRDNRYPGDGEIEVVWEDRVYDLRELTNLWICVAYFSPIRGIAHIELSFEFADNNNVMASFEIRPLKGQRYSPTAGFRKTFEITLRWVTERDQLYGRVSNPKNRDELYLFEADITHSLMIRLFHAAAERTNDLYETPEWYHSTRNACATNSVSLVNEILPGHVRRTPLVVLPGLLPKVWAKQGLLKLNGTFEETMAAAKINDQLKAIGHVDDFSAQLHGRTQ